MLYVCGNLERFCCTIGNAYLTERAMLSSILGRQHLKKYFQKLNSKMLKQQFVVTYYHFFLFIVQHTFGLLLVFHSLSLSPSLSFSVLLRLTPFCNSFFAISLSLSLSHSLTHSLYTMQCDQMVRLFFNIWIFAAMINCLIA